MSTATHETPAPKTEPPNQITPSQQAAIDTLKEGDLILLTAKAPHSPEVVLVTRIATDGTVHIWEPSFSLDGEAGSWTVSGPECYYTAYSDTELFPCAEDALEMKMVAARENPTYVKDDCIRDTLQPLREGEVIRVNPTGLDVMEWYCDGCPYSKCGDHMFCPGCGGVSMDFPDLFMSCGTPLSCPTCMGYEFAYEDMIMLKKLEYDIMDTETEERVFKERCDRVDARRAELGYSKVDWVN